MSRIGKKSIDLPIGVNVKVEKSTVIVTGTKGTLYTNVDTDFKLKIGESTINVLRPTEQKRHKALHGLYRSLINNMVIGVTKGYNRELELVGVGYKASVKNNILELNLGYSHSIFMELPAEVKVKTEIEKGKNPMIILESIDKQLIGDVAAKIKALRPVEPYKGKGIRFKGEFIRKKAGKTSTK